MKLRVVCLYCTIMTSLNDHSELLSAEHIQPRTAQDGNGYTVHPDGSTLIDSEGNYFSSFDLRPLPKHEIDTAHKYACFPDEIVDEVIAAS